MSADLDQTLILRVDARSARVLGGGGILGADARVLADAEYQLDSQNVSPDEREDLARDPGVIGQAEVMPLALHPPVSEVDEEHPYTADDTACWGIDAVGALSSPYRGEDVCVAVLDSGIHAGHAAFVGKQILQEDFTGEGHGDAHGHGTHCAGTAVGADLDGLRIGVAPGVDRLLVGKVLNRHGQGSTRQFVAGLLWAAEQGAQIISMSVGLDFIGQVDRLTALGLTREWATARSLVAYRQNMRLFDTLGALLRARSARFEPCLVIAAAGNESRRPAFEVTSAPPACADGLLAVGALGRSAQPGRYCIAPFSNTDPALCAPGVAIASAAYDDDASLLTTSGTSMATPHVAGVAALWVQALREDNPKFQLAELEANLLAHSRKRVFVAHSAPAARGAGLVQAPQD